MTSLLEYYQKKKCNKVRNPVRASCHFLNKAELMAITGVYMDNLNYGENFNEIARNNAILYLKARGDDLVRGDLIILGPDSGYRDSGVYIYDGGQILDLASEPDPFGSIPPNFQVNQFNPIYWSSVIERNNYVPFDFSFWLPSSKVTDVKLMTQNGYFRLSFPFQDKNNRYWVIVDRAKYPNTLTVEDVNNLAGSFYQTLKSAKYFGYYTPKWYPDLPTNLNPMTTLVSL